MRSRRLTVVAVAALLACSAAGAWAQKPKLTPMPTHTPPTPQPVKPVGPSLKLGALLPLNGPGAWFGAEIKQGLDLAVTELEPAPKPGGSAEGSGTSPSGDGRSATAPGASSGAGTPPADGGGARPAASPPATTGSSTAANSSPNLGPSPSASGSAKSGSSSEPGATSSSADAKKPGTPPAEPVEPPDQPRDVALSVQAADVQPLDMRDAETELAKLLAGGAVAVVTASPTPTLTVYPLASGRDVLVLHAGLATERFPATSRTLIQLRPSAAARADVLAAHARARGIRRLAVVSGGDPFGKAIRAAVAARWRQQGGQLTHEESLSLDASDIRSRLRAVTRTGPDAVLLGYQGTALGEAARALRDAGYKGQILAPDDDRAALLSGGSALEGALFLSDAFVPVPGSRGARFAKAYEAKYGRAPSRFAANAYEAATLLATAAEQLAREARGIAGSRLRDLLVKTGRFPSLYAGELVVRDDGTIGRPLALFRVTDGKLAFEDYIALDGVALAVPKEATP